MAIIYVRLIEKGIRTYESVPKVIQPQVKELMIKMKIWKEEENAS